MLYIPTVSTSRIGLYGYTAFSNFFIESLNKINVAAVTNGNSHSDSTSPYPL